MRLSPNSISTYEACPRKFLIKKYFPTKSENVHLAFGKALHDAAELLANGENPFQVVDTFATKDYNFGNKTPEALNSCITKLLSSSANYEILHSEIAFEIKFPAYSLSGRIDQIVKTDFGIFFKDFKTTKSEKKYYFDQFKPNHQIYIYALACNQMEIPVCGAWIEKYKILKREVKVDHKSILVTKQELINYLAVLNNVINSIFYRLVQPCDKILSFEPRYSSCVPEYGYRCGFYEICRAFDAMQAKHRTLDNFISLLSDYYEKSDHKFEPTCVVNFREELLND